MNYDAASRLTTSTAGGVTTTYTFDSNGNLTGVNEAGTLTTMVYDKENRLKEHKQGAAANTRTFTYDLNSLKQAETFSNATNQLVWDGADMLGEVPAAKPVGAPLIPTRYNLAPGILFATTRFEPDPVRTDTGADFIGSILTDFDENGDYVAERRYKPYGELLAGTATTYGWTGNTGSRATLLQYAEQYNRRRHYSTKLKQWTTRDPLWPEESAYGYVRGGPLTLVDSDGNNAAKSSRTQNGYGVGLNYLIPPGAVPQCTKEWNVWIYAYCNRFTYDTWNRQLCNWYAERYVIACKKEWKWIRDFQFRPPDSSRGEVTYQYSGNQFCEHKHQYFFNTRTYRIIDCLKAGDEAYGKAAASKPNLLPGTSFMVAGQVCRDCCSVHRLGNECLKHCNYLEGLFIIIYVNNFSTL